MKTRKQQTPARKRAPPGPAKSRAKAGLKARAARSRVAAAAEEGPLTLGAECTAAEADALKAELARRVAASEPIIVDVSALQRIDTAGMQLLAAFVRDRRTGGRIVQWRGQAAALELAARLLGLKDMLELAGEVGR